jgi:hypothetical protein
MEEPTPTSIQEDKSAELELNPYEKMRCFRIPKTGISKREQSRKRRGQKRLTEDQKKDLAPALNKHWVGKAQIDAVNRRYSKVMELEANASEGMMREPYLPEFEKLLLRKDPSHSPQYNSEQWKWKPLKKKSPPTQSSTVTSSTSTG